MPTKEKINKKLIESINEVCTVRLNLLEHKSCRSCIYNEMCQAFQNVLNIKPKDITGRYDVGFFANEQLIDKEVVMNLNAEYERLNGELNESSKL